MKILVFIIFSAVFAFSSGVFVPPRHPHRQHLLGAKECTWGPSYWCQNLTAAADCHAVPHCIQTVWVHKQLPPDTSNVCQTCLDMVKQARDQLESNETQELIKEVFEGSCALIHIKPVVEECDKIADQYIPELIDTLASEMNPQVVCSVAGLCNNERLQQLIEQEAQKIALDKANDNPIYECKKVIPIMESNFKGSSRDEVRNNMLELCRGLSSFTDYCSAMIIKYFNDIYDHLNTNLNVENVCRLFTSSESVPYPGIEVTPVSHIGYVNVDGDDLPCDLCEQLVGHLRDLLIANTTEDEFKRVLEGLCKQTNSFKAECLEMCDQYYDVIYNYLVSELNGTEICIAAGICPRGPNYMVPPLVPLLPEDAVNVLQSSQPAPLSPGRVVIPTDDANIRVIQSPELMQLPIERIMPPHMQDVYNSQVCVLCEYVLHYIQQAITNPATEEQVKEAVEKVCNDLPDSVKDSCTQFVENYGDALAALLAQEIDPSQVCPMIRACPAQNQNDIEIFIQQQGPSSRCPLCLFAVTRLEEMVKDDKTEANIKNSLDHLCEKLSHNLAQECVDFVNTYTNELVEMLVADLTPQEVCVYLKLCPDKNIDSQDALSFNGGEIETNMIPDNTVNGIPVTEESLQVGPQCVVCEFIMKEIEDELKNKNNEDEIEKVVRDICNVMPKTVSKECNDFVDQYANTIIQLLIEALEPKEICAMMKVCFPSVSRAQGEILDCAVCESLTIAIDKIMSNPRVDHSTQHVLEKACVALPFEDQERCRQMTETYGRTLYNWVLSHADKHYVCKHIGLCAQEAVRPNIELLGADKCSRGPGYWCTSEATASECGEGAILHCQEKVWQMTRRKREVEQPSDHLRGADKCSRGPDYWCLNEGTIAECGAQKHCQEKVWTNQRPKRQVLVGGNKCTWGPSYWCANQENARECGAEKHCQEKVWTNERSKRQLVGDDKCSWGPSYWCASQENARECDAEKHCQERVWTNERPKRQLVGDDKCSWGPSYWCASQENARECDAEKHCQEKVWTNERPKRQLVGDDKCSWGPSYWCASQENARECDAEKHCQEQVWTNERSKRQLVGDDKCSWGPSYWCANQENARECDAEKHCQEKVWTNERSKRQLVGDDKCSWGPSYWCASQENARECDAEKHCQEKVWTNERSKRQLVGDDKCSWGPSYWCASQENARECDAEKHCQEKVWTNQRSKRQLVGDDKCSWGPSYWCANQENARECDAEKHCQEKVWTNQRSKRQLVGDDKCSWGPSYWCANQENARECGAEKHCQEKVWTSQRSKRQLVGDDKCSWGPSYWCANQENARECDAEKHCQEQVWTNQRSKRQLVGDDKCSWGPSYWCANQENARECGAEKHCQEKVWTNQRPTRQVLVGGNKCTWGPSYWCANQENAKECDAEKHCQEKVWTSQRSKRQLVGDDKCSWGPSYWCANQENARECGGEKHCQEKVWTNQRPTRQVLVGGNKCTWGPSYWCANQENARECGAEQHCEEKVWTNQRSKRQLVGGDKCSWGPSYWCANQENARECGALQHCQEKVWNRSQGQ